MARIAILVAALLTLGGCARTISVTYESDPQGATLYANHADNLVGYTPYILRYKATKAFRQGRECLVLQPARVRWSSGAEASIDDLSVCAGDGFHQQFVFVRPNVPGVEIDAQFAGQLLNARATVQAAATEDDPPPPTYATPTHCTSRRVGWQIRTTCY